MDNKDRFGGGVFVGLLFFAMSGLVASLHGQTTTWTAGSETDFNWSNNANWDSAEPGLADDVIFPAPIPDPGSLGDPDTIFLSVGEQAKTLTFEAGGYLLSGGTLQLASPGTVTVTTDGHTARIDSVLTGAGGLTKLGAGTLVLGGANDFTGDTRILNGTTRIASGGSIGVASASAGSLQIGESNSGTAILIVDAGGGLKVGSGASSQLLVGTRTTPAGATSGTLDLSAAATFTANVGLFQVGGSTSTSTSNVAGTAVGVAILAQDNTITASEGILVAEMAPAVGNTGVTSRLVFGSGTNHVTTPYLLVGGSRSVGELVIAAGGTLNLANGAGKTDIAIGSNRVDNTGTFAAGTMDMSGGILNASLGAVIVGERVGTTNQGSGTGTGVLTLGATANAVTADSLILGNLLVSAASSNITQGTLNMAGGTFAVAGDVSLGIHVPTGGLARGTLNLTGGAFTVGGNITKTAKTTSTAIIIVDGATLDLTGGAIAASQLAWRSGSIDNVASVTLDAISTTTGTGNAGDALILGDVNVDFDISLSGASGGAVHYEAGTAASGATIGGNLALGGVERIFDIEDNVNAAVDMTVSGIISGAGGITKTSAGTLRFDNANTYTGVTTVSNGVLLLNHAEAVQDSTVTINAAGGVVFAGSIADFTFGGLAGNSSGTLVLEDADDQAVALATGGNNASTAYSGTISGSGTLTKAGSGILTLSGGNSNTYSGLTTVSGGSLTLNKSGGATAIVGHVDLVGGGNLRFGSNPSQLGAAVQLGIDGNNSTFNGTGSNAGRVDGIDETFASLSVVRGVVNLGNESVVTVTGAASYAGTGGATTGTSTMHIGNSGSSFIVGSLSLTDMVGAGGTGAADSFTVFGNNAAIQTLLHVGAGGLALNNSNLYLNLGADANVLGSVLVLDGDIAVGGASLSMIRSQSGSQGKSEVRLSGSVGVVTREIETNADLTIQSDITDGAATLANLTKTGAAKLTLSGNNSFTGHLQVDAGALSFSSEANLGDGSATNTLGLGSNTLLQFTGSGVADLTENRSVSLGGGAATINVAEGAGNLILSGNLAGAGTGALAKTGAGTLTLAGSDLSALLNRGIGIDAGGLSFVNGTGQTLNLGNGTLHFGDQTRLYLEIGAPTNFDSIATSAVATVASNATIRIAAIALDDIVANQTYDLVTAGAGSGFDAGALTWNLSLAGSYRYQLNLTDTVVQLETLGLVTGDAYWRGDVSGSWSDVILGTPNNTNWATSVAGTTDREATPGAATTVFFSADSASGPAIDTTLDNHFTINDLVFLGSPAGVTNVAIAQGSGGTLTLAPSSSTQGIAVQDNAGAIAISAPTVLGAAQTWTVSAAGASLNVSGAISGGDAATLTKSGAGNLTLSGVNTHTGRTVLAGGTLAINNEIRLGSNPGAFVADQLTFAGGTLQTTANFAIDDANRGIALESAGGVFNTNSSTTLTIANVIAGSGGLTKSGGTGTLTLAGANTFTGDTLILSGTMRIASGGSVGVAGAAAGSLQVGNRTTATLFVEAGGNLEVGNGSSSHLYVGTRTVDAGSAATVGTINLSAANSFNADVGQFYIGVANTASNSGTTRGIVTLAHNNNIVASTEILVGQMTPALNNTTVVSELSFGAGSNNIATPLLTLGGRKSAAISMIAADGVLNLVNGAGKTDLYIGRNNNTGTSTEASGNMDLSAGTFNATLGMVVLGERSNSAGAGSGGDGTATGSGTGTLSLGSANNQVTADTLILGNLLTTRETSTLTTQGTLNMGGGSFSVVGDVGLGIHLALGGLSTGTLNLTGGTFTVGGNIVSTNKAASNAIVTLDGATLDMTGGTIDANALNARSGILKDVAEIFNGGGTVVADLVKTTGGTLILEGTNSYKGETIVEAGILVINANQTSATGAITIADGAILAGEGTIGATSIAGVTGGDGTDIFTAGPVVAGNPAGSIGTLSFAADLAVSNVTWLVDLVQDLNESSDLIDVRHGELALTNVTLALATTGDFTVGHVYRIARYGSLSTTFNGLAENDVVSGYRIDYGSGTDDFITLTAIPEPGTMGLLGIGAGGIFLLCSRRRRSRDSLASRRRDCS